MEWLRWDVEEIPGALPLFRLIISPNLKLVSLHGSCAINIPGVWLAGLVQIISKAGLLCADGERGASQRRNLCPRLSKRVITEDPPLLCTPIGVQPFVASSSYQIYAPWQSPRFPLCPFRHLLFRLSRSSASSDKRPCRGPTSPHHTKRVPFRTVPHRLLPARIK